MQYVALPPVLPSVPSPLVRVHAPGRRRILPHGPQSRGADQRIAGTGPPPSRPPCLGGIPADRRRVRSARTARGPLDEQLFPEPAMGQKGYFLLFLRSTGMGLAPCRMLCAPLLHRHTLLLHHLLLLSGCAPRPHHHFYSRALPRQHTTFLHEHYRRIRGTHLRGDEAAPTVHHPGNPE